VIFASMLAHCGEPRAVPVVDAEVPATPAPIPAPAENPAPRGVPAHCGRPFGQVRSDGGAVPTSAVAAGQPYPAV
jgi:hypothetical protein